MAKRRAPEQGVPTTSLLPRSPPLPQTSQRLADVANLKPKPQGLADVANIKEKKTSVILDYEELELALQPTITAPTGPTWSFRTTPQRVADINCSGSKNRDQDSEDLDTFDETSQATDYAVCM